MKVLEKIIEYGLCLFIFLLPWQTRLILREGNLNGYWEYGTFSIYATEILLWVIFLLTAIWWTKKKLKVKSEKLKVSVKSSKLETDNKYKILNTKYLFFILLFFVFYSFISIFWSDYRSVALYAWFRLAEGIGLFLVLQIIEFDLPKLAWSFIFSAVIQAGLGVWQFLTQSTFACKWLGMAFHDPIVSGTFVVETVLRRWLRAYGSLPHPNMLAGFLALGMFFSVWLYQKTDYGFKKLLLPVCFSILTLGLLTTFSKSVIIALAVVSIFLWLLVWITKQEKEIKISLLKFTLIGVMIAIIFGAVFWEPVSTRLYSQERLEIKSTEQRLTYFGEAWQLIKKHPLLGVGLGNYTLAVHDEINPALQSWDYQPVHNIYLLILSELGIIGFLIFSIAIFFYLLSFIFYLKQSRQNIFGIIFFGAVLLLLIGFFDHYLWTLYFGIMFFWLCLGLSGDLKVFTVNR
jgi:O-antigen ligase